MLRLNLEQLPPQASLMGLPVEIRLEILRFLLPDLPTVPHRGPPNMRQHESEFAHYADQLSVAGGGTDREKVVRIP